MAYIYSCLFLGFVPILCAGAGYGVVKLQNSKRRKLKIKQEELKNAQYCKGSVDKMIVREWLHAHHKRLVKIRFGPEEAIHMVDRKGDKLRTISFNNVDCINIEESAETNNKRRPLALIRVPREHDLLLELDSLASRRKFLNKLESFLTAQKKNMSCVQSNRDHILAKAETRERRQKRLEHFFREAYAITFGLAPGERRRRSDSSDGEVWF